MTYPGKAKGGGGRKRRPFEGVLRLALWFLVAVQASPAGASFFDTFGADARGMALGGAMAASAKGWASVHYNPAALALSHDVEFSVGLFSADPSITVDYEEGPEQGLSQYPRDPASLETVTGPAFGLLLPIERLTPKRLPMPWAIGLGIFVPRQALSTTRVIEGTYPYDVIFQDRNSTLALNFAVSTRITPALYVGLGLATQMVTPVSFQFSETASSSAEMTVRFGAPSLIAGVLIRPSERVRIGIVYRMENKVKSHWNVVVQSRFPLSIGGLPEDAFSLYQETTLDRDYVSGYTPENVSLGAAYRFTERFSVTVEVTWYRWSQYRGPLDTPLECAFDNTLVPRIGLLYRITRGLEARAGFYYEPTPVTNQSLGFYPIGNDRFVPSLGLGYTFPAPWGILARPITVDGYFQYHILASESFDRAIPSNPFARNPDLTSSGHVFNLGLSLTFRF